MPGISTSRSGNGWWRTGNGRWRTGNVNKWPIEQKRPNRPVDALDRYKTTLFQDRGNARSSFPSKKTHTYAHFPQPGFLGVSGLKMVKSPKIWFLLVWGKSGTKILNPGNGSPDRHT